MNEMRRICVSGLGYIGLPTSSLLATKGYEVHGVDVKAEVVDTINAGEIHITEPELDVLVRSAVQSGHLKASLEPATADVFIIAVPTPFKDGNVPDLQYVEAATRTISPYLKSGNLLILESTSPVGATECMARWVFEERPELADGSLYIAHCPERVLPGQIIKELVSNDRIVGGIDEKSTHVAAEFYREFVSGEVLPTTCRTAELTKLMENTFRDVNIALANELSMICDHLGVDVWELIELANHHPRVNLLQPGPGVGGHCIAVDPWFVVDSAPDQARLIRTAREVNNSKPEYIAERVQAQCSRLENPVVACFGLTYKADVDDLRESPAREIARDLAQKGTGRILVVEPFISKVPADLEALGVELVNQEEALERADVVVGLVDHAQFKHLSESDLVGKIVIDTRGIWR